MELKKDYIEFQSEISRRGIEYLIHFTPTINLYSILEQEKLMSRRVLENLDIEQFDILDYVQFTDSVRYVYFGPNRTTISDQTGPVISD